MTRLFLSLVIAAVLLPAAATAASAPVALHGKSVVVTWSESRVQRHVGEPIFRQVNASVNFSIYISSAGRVFNRLAFSTGLGTGSTEQIAGAGERSPVANRVPKFSGHSITMFLPTQVGGIRRITIALDDGYSSCRAKIIFAKQQGVSISTGWSPITKKMVEVKSITLDAARCSIRSGNVFGGA